MFAPLCRLRSIATRSLNSLALVALVPREVRRSGGNIRCAFFAAKAYRRLAALFFALLDSFNI